MTCHRQSLLTREERLRWRLHGFSTGVFTPYPRPTYSRIPHNAGAVYQPGDRVDVFITKINSSGSALVYSTLLGGSGFDTLKGLANRPKRQRLLRRLWFLRFSGNARSFRFRYTGASAGN